MYFWPCESIYSALLCLVGAPLHLALPIRSATSSYRVAVQPLAAASVLTAPRVAALRPATASSPARHRHEGRSALGSAAIGDITRQNRSESNRGLPVRPGSGGHDPGRRCVELSRLAERLARYSRLLRLVPYSGDCQYATYSCTRFVQVSAFEYRYCMQPIAPVYLQYFMSLDLSINSFRQRLNNCAVWVVERDQVLHQAFKVREILSLRPVHRLLWKRK